jgi:tetratricopeptide (TPR) repeat protein
MISKHFNWSRWVLVGAIFVLTMTLCSSLAQQTAAIRGRVTDKDGNGLADVKIILVDTQRGARTEFNTDKNGNFYRRGILPSLYGISFSLEGYRTVKQEVKITTERTEHLKITLERFDPRALVGKEFDNGSKLFQEGKYKEAAEVFIAIIEKVPEYAEAHFNLALCYVRMNDMNNAIPSLEKSIELKPDLTTAYGILGEAYLAGKEFDKAINVLSKGVELDQNNPNYYYSLGIAYCSLKKADEAIEVLNKSKELDETFSNIYYLLGVAYNIKGDNAMTIESFEKFIELEPNAPQVEMLKEHIERLRKESTEEKPQN